MVQNVASNLKTLFAHAGVSQIQVGEWLGLSESQITRLQNPEKYGQTWSVPQLAQVADYFDVIPSVFFGSAKEMFEQLPPREQWRLPARSVPLGDVVSQDRKRRKPNPSSTRLLLSSYSELLLRRSVPIAA